MVSYKAKRFASNDVSDECEMTGCVARNFGSIVSASLHAAVKSKLRLMFSPAGFALA